jgi:ABC-2 type transport system permease protein
MEKVIVSFVEENEQLKDRLRRYYDLVVGLALRDVKVRYQLSLLGLYWAVLNPLLMALIWSFVFTQIFNARGPSGIPYMVFLFCNFAFWNLFANSLFTAVNCLTGNASLLTKLYFPRIILPTSSVMARLVDFGFSLIVLVVLMFFFKIMPAANLWWLPILLIVQLIFTLGMAYIVASLNVLYRDVNQIVGILLLLWMYLSPVLYTINQIPKRLQVYFIFNPIGQLVSMESGIVLGNGHVSIYALGITTAISICVFAIGLLVFRWLEPAFAEVM